MAGYNTSSKNETIIQELRNNIPTHRLTLNPIKLGKETASCEREQNGRVQLSQELDQTKQQLEKEESLKQLHKNRKKDTRREVEQLLNTELFCTANITTKKRPQKDNGEQQVAISQEELMAELQAEREKNTKHQEKLDKLTLDQDKQRYEAELLRQQVNKLQHELKRETKANAAGVCEGLLLQATLRVEMDALLRMKTEEISILHYKASKQEQLLKSRIKFESKRNDELITQLQDEKDKNMALQEELKTLRASYPYIQMYEAELLSAKQQVKDLQHELEKETKARAARASEDLPLQSDLRAELEALQCNMAEETSFAPQKSEQELVLMTELLELETQPHQEDTTSQEKTEEKPQDHPSQQELTDQTENEQDEQEEEEEEEEEENGLSDSDPEPEPTDANEMGATRPKTVSRWKRFRHATGLRKPERWKRRRESSSNITNTDTLPFLL